jgi:hypothetical protein
LAATLANTGGAIALSGIAGYYAGLIYEDAFNQAPTIGRAISGSLEPLNIPLIDDHSDEVLDVLYFIQSIYEDSDDESSCPIILDLDGDGVETLNMADTSVYFDHNRDGFAQRTGWAGADDGILVRDLNGNGQIDNGGELFGDNTLISGVRAANGFEALKALDNNKDGKFSSADTAWNTVNVWKDSNSNGSVDTGEILTLAQAKVASINLDYTSGHRTITKPTTTTGKPQATPPPMGRFARRTTCGLPPTAAIPFNWLKLKCPTTFWP